MNPRTHNVRTAGTTLTASAQTSSPETSPETSFDSTKRPVITRGRAWRVLLIASLLPLTAAAPALGPAVANPAPDPNKTGLMEKKLVPDLLGTMQKLRIPGAIVSVTMPKWGTTTAALGTDNLGTGHRIAAADHMRIGDITRTFTGTVILQLADAHRLRLDAPVARVITGVPNGQHITIRQLLRMTSGLYDYAADQSLNQTLDKHPETHFTPRDLLAVAYKHKPYFAPGKGFHSSATDTVLLGMIAERITAQPLQTLFEQRIFKPLGMKDTRIDNGTAIPAPVARGYQYVGNAASLTAPALTGKDAAWADYSAGKPADVTQANASWTWAAGAATSTLADLNRWVSALATGKLLSPQMQKEQRTFTPTSTAPGAAKYGLAVADYAGFLGHDGRIPGYSGFIGYDPKRQAAVVVLANSDRSPDGTVPAAELMKRVLADVFTG
jgi:D-alanyl-D-alanine carboxypeptidase